MQPVAGRPKGIAISVVDQLVKATTDDYQDTSPHEKERSRSIISCSRKNNLGVSEEVKIFKEKRHRERRRRRRRKEDTMTLHVSAHSSLSLFSLLNSNILLIKDS